MIPGLVASGVAAATFSPPDLTNLYAWYKGDGTLWQEAGRTTPATANNDPVGAWDDAGASAYHVTGNCTLKTGGPNGKPYVAGEVAFAGLSRTGLPGWTGGVTFFIVARGGGVTPSSDYWINLTVGSTQSVIAGFEASGMVEYFSTPRVNCGTCDGSTWAVYEFVDLGDGAASSAVGLKNGTATETATGSSKTFGTLMEIFHAGSANHAQADFAEIIIYKQGKDATDRGTVRSYLGAKYGITVS